MRPRALIATARRQAALWSQATEIRQEWFDVGTSTKPVDHHITEEAIASIYARHGRRRPEFVRVTSPRAALAYLDGLPAHEDLLTDSRPRPVASDIAAGLSRLRSSLEADFTEPPAERPRPKRKNGERWPRMTPEQALDAGLPFHEVLVQGVREELLRRLSGIYLPIRAALGPVPVGWYGHQDAYWVAFVDVLRRTGLAPVREEREFEVWATLTRSGGWWWPGDHRCVLVERPVTLRTDPLFVEYGDGWSVGQAAQNELRAHRAGPTVW
ncbi:DUF6745 domain-containing protein [Paractinoplanes brasiliensis]|uniref:DUF6745 domain-containing protein n=1 Tax=Paractinoplanes brasiliensis TaxID=52695 RepID=A0A4R6JW92_9ACTN|nr:hypothetical protein [Actinoplanes brasiliensis]TDO40959.1 hypothetical protein C8E87_4680 [Actinoplanes brasiliensis]GID26027.1 hypothetical protein Abr02nite_10100 [Actinoplanes brasiliensis]